MSREFTNFCPQVKTLARGLTRGVLPPQPPLGRTLAREEEVNRDWTAIRRWKRGAGADALCPNLMCFCADLDCREER